MRAIDAYEALRGVGQPVVTTREAAVRMRTSVSAASHALRSMDESGMVKKLRRGLWSLERDPQPHTLPPYLTSPFPAYVSFWSALARHGLIEQVPGRIFVASLDRSKQIATSVGTFSIHHLAPELFGGFEPIAGGGFVASAEKAVFDSIYIRAVRRQTGYFPELSRPSEFDGSEVERWAQRVPSPRERTIVSRRVEEVLGRYLRRSGSSPG